MTDINNITPPIDVTARSSIAKDSAPGNKPKMNLSCHSPDWTPNILSRSVVLSIQTFVFVKTLPILVVVDVLYDKLILNFNSSK